MSFKCDYIYYQNISHITLNLMVCLYFRFISNLNIHMLNVNVYVIKLLFIVISVNFFYQNISHITLNLIVCFRFISNLNLGAGKHPGPLLFIYKCLRY